MTTPPTSAPRARPYADAPRLPPGSVQAADLLRCRCARIGSNRPGRGGFLLERLAARPDVGMVGLEIRRKWATVVDQRLSELGFGDRGRVFAEDAREALARLEPAGCLAAVFLHFPDPWWKKRHHKRLVVGRGLLDEVARLLAPGADLFVQTDVPERAEAYEAQIAAHGCFSPSGDLPGCARVSANPYGATSHRERRAIQDALPVCRLRFARRG